MPFILGHPLYEKKYATHFINYTCTIKHVLYQEYPLYTLSYMLQTCIAYSR